MRLRQRTAIGVAAAAVSIMALAGAAVAQAPSVQPGYYGINTPSGVLDFCAIEAGALPSTVFHPCHVPEVLDSSGMPHPVGATNPMPVANAQEHADFVALEQALATPLFPPGGATSALQISNAAQAHADVLSVLQALATLLQPGGGVVVTSSALPTGAATSSGQATAHIDSAQLHTDLTPANGLPVSGPLTSAQLAAAGLSTAAGQALGLTQATATATNTATDAANNAAFGGAVALPVGTADTQARRSVAAVCTVAGSATLVLADTSTITVPEAVGFQTYPFAATQVSQSTGTCALYNLK